MFVYIWKRPDGTPFYVGKKKHSKEHKAKLREKLLDPNNPMREYHKTLNTDPVIKAKRTATLQSPEVRARISAKLKEKWAERKANIKFLST